MLKSFVLCSLANMVAAYVRLVCGSLYSCDPTVCLRCKFEDEVFEMQSKRLWDGIHVMRLCRLWLPRKLRYLNYV